MLEDKLWKEAIAFDTVAYYLKYLKQGPLQKHRKKAIVRIVGIECDENSARKDMLSHNDVTLLLEYKSRFREEGDLNKVNERIFQELSRPIEKGMEKEQEFQAETHYLSYQLHQHCTGSEIFAFNLIEKVKNRLELKLGDLIEKTEKLKDVFSGKNGLLPVSIVIAAFFVFHHTGFPLLCTVQPGINSVAPAPESCNKDRI